MLQGMPGIEHGCISKVSRPYVDTGTYYGINLTSVNTFANQVRNAFASLTFAPAFA